MLAFRAAAAFALIIVVHSLLSCCELPGADLGTIQFVVNDRDGQPTPCRIHCFDEEGEPQRSVGQPFWHDHFVCAGRAQVQVAAGKFRWEIERGPEYGRAVGVTEVTAGGESTVTVVLSRVANLRAEGWYSGDLHVHRAVGEIEQLMRAEDLDFAPVIGWWNQPATNATAAAKTEFRFDGHRIYTTMAGEDEREGGALLFFGLQAPLDLSVKSREYPSPLHFVTQARERNPNVWIDIEKPFWWDVPAWLASGQMNSIGIANNHMCRSQMLASEAWGKPRDPTRLPNPRGNGYWTQEIYYHLLNAGIRLPPSAGSASGVLPNPVGYNRVYVHLGDHALTRDHWFEALSAGRSFVTNGPLLRVRAGDTLPGSDIQFADSAAQTVELSIELTSLDPVSEVEVVYNGTVVQTIPCTSDTQQQLSAKLSLDQPGWFIVRAIADVQDTFRFASTAPWYVESKQVQRPVNRTSAQFFLDWVNERIERVEETVTDSEQRQAVLKWHIEARDFWRDRVQVAADSLGQQFSPVPQRDASLAATRLRLSNVLPQGFHQPDVVGIIRRVQQSDSLNELRDAVAPLVLLSVSINPESRVKLAATRDRVTVGAGLPQRFLAWCENTAGTTAPLRVVAIDVSTNPPQPATWCDVNVIDGPLVFQQFTGAEYEFKIIELTVQQPGLREVRLVADVGQGTQDLGFRASTDLMLEAVNHSISKPKE